MKFDGCSVEDFSLHSKRFLVCPKVWVKGLSEPCRRRGMYNQIWAMVLICVTHTPHGPPPSSQRGKASHPPDILLESSRRDGEKAEKEKEKERKQKQNVSHVFET